MNRTFLILFASLVFVLPSAAFADLNTDISSILRDKILAKSDVGMEIVKLAASNARPQVLFRHNSDIHLIPASNLTIAATSAYLEKLGPNFNFRTMLVRGGDD